MQDDLRTALRSRSRLAALGEAVAKINHDLRNMLTSAQVVAERLQGLGDPRVTQALPRLERALDRAVRLAQNVMVYGKSEEAPPKTRPVDLRAVAAAAGEDAGLTPDGVALRLDVPEAFHVEADPEQLDRILVNLLKNAREAIEASDRRTGEVRLSAEARPGAAVLTFRDDGPGVPERLRERLFQPFAGSGRPGGSGLGLAIARELARGHGGELTLEHAGSEGFDLRAEIADPRRGASTNLTLARSPTDGALPSGHSSNRQGGPQLCVEDVAGPEGCYP